MHNHIYVLPLKSVSCSHAANVKTRILQRAMNVLLLELNRRFST